MSFPQLPTSLRSRLGAVVVAAVLVGLLIAPASIVAASAAENDQPASSDSGESVAEPADDPTELDRASEVAGEALAFTGPEVDHTALAGSIMTAVGMLLVAAAKRFTEPDWY